jgi:sugar phosphate isomerase/epimerase
MKLNQIGLQLYTVREYLTDEENAMKMLETVREIGYETIQLSFSPFDAKFYKRAKDEFGFTICGMDVSMERMQNDIGGVIEDCKMLDLKYITRSFNSDKFMFLRAGTRADFDEEKWKFIEDICKVGENLKGTGVSFAYHNHSFEFAMENGKAYLEDFYDMTHDAGILAEIDTYWVQHGGGDPACWIRRLAGRTPIIHLKDMFVDIDDKAQTFHKFAPVGSGNMNWKPIIEAGNESGVNWFVVEQDLFDKPSLECARDSFTYLKNFIAK